MWVPALCVLRRPSPGGGGKEPYLPLPHDRRLWKLNHTDRFPAKKRKAPNCSRGDQETETTSFSLIATETRDRQVQRDA